MIMAQTPFRVSFFGGGTDYEQYFSKYGGSVLSTTIDKYVYTYVRKLPPFFDFHTQAKYSITESVRKTEELQHPLIRSCMQHLNAHNLSIIYDADLPARSGLGSSSSFAVGLLQSLYGLQNKHIDKKTLAKEAIYVERVLCDEAGGWQDQIAVTYGGLNRIDFAGNDFTVNPIALTKERKDLLQSYILMFFTGVSRLSSDIARQQEKDAYDKIAELQEMKNLVDEAQGILLSQKDLLEFGKLLDTAWKLKRGMSDIISSEYIDTIYKTGINNGAVGGKLLGAGGGGFIMLFAPPEAHKGLCKALDHLLHIPISFENEGSKIEMHNS
ncbi:MAG: kinase [Oscillospiraceae bacterium]|jgi:D-glycero-alpha-D-manno-heptose-7-phosphate kinase|nr:kinase [Oscillospiraceae bacterium]